MVVGALVRAHPCQALVLRPRGALLLLLLHGVAQQGGAAEGQQTAAAAAARSRAKAKGASEPSCRMLPASFLSMV